MNMPVAQEDDSSPTDNVAFEEPAPVEFEYEYPEEDLGVSETDEAELVEEGEEDASEQLESLDTDAGPELDTVKDLTEMEVLGTDIELPGLDIDLTKSSTTMGRQEIERRQASTLMELVDNIAGISGVGGVRSGSQGFNIRGFSSNEDILKIVDGARQNFERYRYGNGLDIDPDLVQQIEVIRGNSVRTAGYGTIGGAVITKTKNARDLLEPGEKFGLDLKMSYWDNNNQKKGSVTAYAQPFKNADALINIIKNDSNDVTLPDGSRLENSESKQFSGLAKVSIFSLDYNIDIGYRYSDENVAEPFDAFDVPNGIGGLVRRTKITRSPTMNLNWNPESDWLNLDATIAYNDQFVQDKDSTFANGGTDKVTYKILNLELKNRSQFFLGSVDSQIDYGVQFNRERRDYKRFFPNTGVAVFNEAQPPGEKKSYGAYLDTEFNLADWTVNSGVRFDNYSVSTGGLTAEALRDQGREDLLTNDFNDLINFGAGLSYQPRQGPLTIFYNYGQSFRVPLIDELYTLGSGGFSRCSVFSTFQQRPEPPAPGGAPYTLSTGATTNNLFVAIADYTTFILPAYQSNPFRDELGSCAGFYEPETTETHELGLSLNWGDLFNSNGELTSKLTYYRIRTDNLIESIFENSVTGEISQPGVENREGWELELNYESNTWFGSLAMSILDGSIEFNYFDNNIDTRVRALNPSDREPVDLFSVPGDTLNLTLGRRHPEHSFEYGYRLSITGPRLELTGTENPDIPECGTTTTILSPIPTCNEVEEQGGFTLHNLFFRWQPFDNTQVGLTINNLTNKRYQLPGFAGALGVTAAGRDVRFTIEHQF